MPTGDVYKLSLFSNTTQRQNINTHYYRAGSVEAADPFEEAEALAQAWNSTVLSGYVGALSADVEFGCIKVEKVLGVEIPTWISFFDEINGVRPTGALPPNVVGIIRRRGTDGTKALRSLLFITGISNTDALGSFLTAAFIAGPYATMLNLFNDELTSSPSFQSATWEPVIPHTPRVYARSILATVSVTTNVITRDDGLFWDAEGFISADGFRILAPNKNRGSYTATIVPASTTINLSNNRLEGTGQQTMSFQQATGPTAYFQLVSTLPQTALRQLKRRRSSHTGIVA